MAEGVAREVVELIRSQRWAALATVGSDGPLSSMVGFACEPGFEGLLVYLSGLAQHTRNLAGEPRVSLAITVPDTGDGDPQTLPRVSVQARVQPIARETPEFEAAWQTYVARFPSAASRLALGDFTLMRLQIDSARYVGGFARAATIRGDDLRREAKEIER